jgi:hypothetical protein
MVGKRAVKSGYDIKFNAARLPTLRVLALYLSQTKKAIIQPTTQSTLQFAESMHRQNHW